MHYGKDRKNQMVQEICKYVEDHLCEDLSHVRIQAQFGLRPYDLTITFQKKSYYNTNLHQSQNGQI